MAVSASALPGAIVIADEGNNRIVLVDANGKVQWTFPQKGDLAPGQSFKTPDDALMLPDGLQLVPDNAKANFPGLQ